MNSERYLAEESLVGEVVTSMEREVARHVNGKVRDQHEDVQISLPDLGDHSARDTRFRSSVRQGFLDAYVRTREYGEDHTVITKITVSTVAVGAVLTAIAALRYQKKK